MSKADEDKALLSVLWLYINPVNQEQVEKAATFDFLLLMIFNISRLSENEMCEILAKHMIDYYTQTFGLDFDLRMDYGET